jgi:hypothetical protein
MYTGSIVEPYFSEAQELSFEDAWLIEVNTEFEKQLHLSDYGAYFEKFTVGCVVFAGFRVDLPAMATTGAMVETVDWHTRSLVLLCLDDGDNLEDRRHVDMHDLWCLEAAGSTHSERYNAAKRQVQEQANDERIAAARQETLQNEANFMIDELNFTIDGLNRLLAFKEAAAAAATAATARRVRQATQDLSASMSAIYQEALTASRASATSAALAASASVASVELELQQKRRELQLSQEREVQLLQRMPEGDDSEAVQTCKSICLLTSSEAARQYGNMARRLPVSQLRWTQDTIHSKMQFSDERSLYQTLDQLLRDARATVNLFRLELVVHDGSLYSLDNRRLTVLKMYQACTGAEVFVNCVITDASRDFWRKLKTRNKGQAIGLDRRFPDAQEAYHQKRLLFM